MAGFFLFGGLLILIGTVFALEKDVYMSWFIFWGTTLNEHDSIWTGIAFALLGVLMVGIGIYQYFRNKSKPDS